MGEWELATWPVQIWQVLKKRISTLSLSLSSSSMVSCSFSHYFTTTVTNGSMGQHTQGVERFRGSRTIKPWDSNDSGLGRVTFLGHPAAVYGFSSTWELWFNCPVDEEQDSCDGERWFTRKMSGARWRYDPWIQTTISLSSVNI